MISTNVLRTVEKASGQFGMESLTVDVVFKATISGSHSCDPRVITKAVFIMWYYIMEIVYRMGW